MEIRALRATDRAWMEQFLYWAIHVPEGETPLPFEVIHEPLLARSLTGFGTIPGDQGVVALEDDEPVGACWVRTVPQYGFLDHQTPSLVLSVAPDKRDKGIGTALLTTMIEKVRQTGARRMSLSVQPDNRAVHLYRRMGFRRLGGDTAADLWVLPLDGRIREAGTDDVPWLLTQDLWVPEDALRAAVSEHRVLLIERDGQPMGWLRWGLFWDSIPIMHMLRLVPEARGQGYGTQLAYAWESVCRQRGVLRVLTSTQVDESAQHFYRTLGYVDSGMLLLPDQAAELFFIKSLSLQESVT